MTLQTPFEQSNGNQTTTWRQCIDFYQVLAARHADIFQFTEIGLSDAGFPLHAGVVSADGVFDAAAVRAQGRPVFFNNNGIHPGEPEGIDACMALVRDLLTSSERLAALGRTVYLFIPVYNVDGCLNRSASSRVNQNGPEAFGFRGNSLNLDLNRDFIKCDSLNAQCFSRLFTAWSPDVMVDTHTSNGADYSYTMTLIATQPDKLGGALGDFLRETMLPAIFEGMQTRGWPTCPYVDSVGETPDDGIADFLEVPRFSTGYAALHHTIGFMPETHMLKPFADRYASTRALLDVTLAFTTQHADTIGQLRRQARAHGRQRTDWPVRWAIDRERPTTVRFQGYAAVRRPSLIGRYQRLAYDRSQPWDREIAYFNRLVESERVAAPLAYVVPRAWRHVVERLRCNGVEMHSLASDRTATARVHRIERVQSRPGAYEGHLFHDELTLQTGVEPVSLAAGDWWISLDQDAARYLVETLEPQGHDSFFRWGFFDSILEKKQHFSDYVFEDLALELLAQEPRLKAAFDPWSAAHPELLADQDSVLGFIFEHCERYAEPTWRRYPVLAVMSGPSPEA